MRNVSRVEHIPQLSPTLPDLEIALMGADVRGLDRLCASTLAVSFFMDDRPLQGVAGLVDWRTNGLLSRLILEGRISGEQQEVLLFPSNRRLGATKVLAFGMGDRHRLDGASLRLNLRQQIRTIEGMKASHVALSLPSLRGSAEAVVTWYEEVVMRFSGQRVEFMGQPGELEEVRRLVCSSSPGRKVMLAHSRSSHPLLEAQAG